MAVNMISKNVRMSEPVVKTMLIEFERVLLPGASFLYEVLEEILKANKFAFNDNMFRRFFLNNALKTNIQNLFFALDKDNPAIDKLLQQITNLYLKKVASFKGDLSGMMSAFIDSAVSSSWRVLLITKLSKETVVALASRTSYIKKCEIYQLDDINTPFIFTTKKQWHNILNANKIMPKSAIAFSDNNFSIKTAIAVGISAVAIPNKFTEHQDFIGADIVVEDTKMPSLQECEQLLTPVAFL